METSTIMSTRSYFFSQFFHLPYFTKQTLVNTAKRISMPAATLNSYIQRGVARGELVCLKRGCYVTSDFFHKHKSNTDYRFYIANILLPTSYVSLESALQYYGVLAEAVDFAVTSVSLKTPRTFKNRLGVYTYRHISKRLFDGYSLTGNSFEYKIAEPYKALIDFFYYRVNLRAFTVDNIFGLLDEYRLDYEELDQKQQKKFIRFIKDFRT